MAPQNIKLTYFNGRGRIEVSRLVLVAAGKEFEDVRVPEFTADLKAKTPFGQLPLLEVDGEVFAQSVAIATYLAREFGLYGKTNLDGLRIDQVVQLVQEILNAGYKAYLFTADETQKAQLIKELKEKEFPRYLEYFENLLKNNGTGYFVGDSLTLADLIVYDVAFAFIQRGFGISGYPLVEALYSSVESHPRIKPYVAQRQPTPN
ncbi:unnamed protein product [Lymnaea stagnalis]|uniref:Glutathione S-transferase n=1 Tax=Lymnaea stagnalis TaxID=6523 RepID=A0AAV2H5A7_LYMST